MIRRLFSVFMRCSCLTPFWLVTLSQPYSRASTIFVDEFDARSFERVPNDLERRATRPARAGFQLMDGNNPNASFVCKVLLAPIKQAAGRATLCRGDHLVRMAQPNDSYNSIRKLLTPTQYIIYVFIKNLYLPGGPACD